MLKGEALILQNGHKCGKALSIDNAFPQCNICWAITKFFVFIFKIGIEKCGYLKSKVSSSKFLAPTNQESRFVCLRLSCKFCSHFSFGICHTHTLEIFSRAATWATFCFYRWELCRFYNFVAHKSARSFEERKEWLKSDCVNFRLVMSRRHVIPNDILSIFFQDIKWSSSFAI